jgi:hypothetical protein
MGKHERGYARQERDHYPTPAWVTRALLRLVAVEGLSVWEPAAGAGDMVRVLREHGGLVFASDIERRGFSLDAVHDFTGLPLVALGRRFDAIITNPPFGARGAGARAFIEAGLRQLAPGGILALLLPADYDSAGGRSQYFGDSVDYVAKLVLTRRVVWFERLDGVREAPKENHAWFIWQRSPLRLSRSAVVIYAGGEKPGKHAVIHSPGVEDGLSTSLDVR